MQIKLQQYNFYSTDHRLSWSQSYLVEIQSCNKNEAAEAEAIYLKQNTVPLVCNNEKTKLTRFNS